MASLPGGTIASAWSRLSWAKGGRSFNVLPLDEDCCATFNEGVCVYYGCNFRIMSALDQTKISANVRFAPKSNH
jgi:hypothetical protein